MSMLGKTVMVSHWNVTNLKNVYLYENWSELSKSYLVNSSDLNGCTTLWNTSLMYV